MEARVRMWLDKKTSQVIFGELETKITATLKNAEEITKRTGGRVWINKSEGTLREVFDYESGFIDVNDAMVDEIKRIILETVKRTGNKMVEIDINTLDWEKIQKVLNRAEERVKEKLEREKRQKEIEQKLNEFINNFNSKFKEEISISTGGKCCGKYSIYIDVSGMAIKALYLGEEEIPETSSEFEIKVLTHTIKYLTEFINKSRELSEELEKENELLREFISKHHTAEEIVEWLKRRKGEELEEEIWDEASRLIPELFEEEEEEEDY